MIEQASEEAAPEKSRWRPMALRFAIVITVAVYLANAFILTSIAPSSDITGATVTQRGDSTLLEVSDLTVGGTFNEKVKLVGYVNILEEEPRIFVDSAVRGDTSSQVFNNIILKHEDFHILQKKLLAKEAGGYPSYWNPIQTAIYLVKLGELSSFLDETMPRARATALASGGLEASADCYAASWQDKRAFFDGPYIGQQKCTEAQVALVKEIAKGEWPLG